MLKLKLTLFSCLLLLTSNVYSSSIKILKLKGNVLFNGKEVKKGQIYQKKGSIQVGPKSFVKFQAIDWKTNIVLGPKSQMSIIKSELTEKSDLKLIKGAARWFSNSIKSVDKRILTKNVALGVRGTEFFVRYNDTLGESEVVVFKGIVHMQNPKDATDHVLLKKNQWGGIGGRYGEEIGEILSLSSDAMSEFDKFLKI